MRVSADVRHATRRRILDTSRDLFLGEGFGDATTRDIARAAGIANGTLFNYFPTKEAIAAALAAEALAEARCRFERKGRQPDTLEEGLFSLIAEELRALKPHRGYLRPALETTLWGPAGAGQANQEDPIRSEHLRIVARLMADHGHAGPTPFVTLHLYWTLYIGVLVFWAADPSPNQEDTRALLDRSLRAFAISLPSDGETR